MLTSPGVTFRRRLLLLLLFLLLLLRILLLHLLLLLRRRRCRECGSAYVYLRILLKDFA